MIRLMLLVVAASFLWTGAAMANSETESRKETPTAEVQQPTEAKTTAATEAKAPARVRMSTRDRWRGRPYTRAVAVENAERDVQLLPIDQPIPSAGFAEDSVQLRNEALNKSLHFAVSAGSSLPF